MSYNEQLRCDNLTTNHEGAIAWRMTPEWELYTAVVTMMGVEDKFYERGNDRVRRVASLVRKTSLEFVARLAVYTREQMHLRSVPLLLVVELARHHHGDSLVSRTVARTVQRADEITELLMCWQWRTHKKDLTGLSVQLRKGLAESFNRFDEYQFAKYDRRNRKVTLCDALLLVHPKPKDEAQAALFKKILNDTLETPYTWETRLSEVGQHRFEPAEEKAENKRAAWQELVRSRRMGYMATVRNLQNMLQLHLDDESMQQVCDYIADPEAVRKSKQLPFRFLSAYMQLAGNSGNSHQWTMDDVHAKVCMMEEVLERRKNGDFPVRTRKVCAFHPESAASIANRAAVPAELGYSWQRMHCGRMIHVRKHYSQLSERQQAEVSRLERVLARLKRREESLTHAQDKWPGYTARLRTLQALEAAAKATAANIPGFDEDTRVLLASDVSGSMWWFPVSRNSTVKAYHIGLLLSMLMKHRCKTVVTGMFGDIWKAYDMPSDCILQNTVDMVSRGSEVGYSTNGHKVIDWLIDEHRVMDKVMIFTDCQLWDSHYGDAHLAKSWTRYKEIAPDARLYLFDLAGHGQSPVSMERNDVFCIAGWSDKVFDILAALERGSSAIDEIRRIIV